MLQKSLVTDSDVIIYDLEDSVAPLEGGKDDARERLVDFLTARLLDTTECTSSLIAYNAENPGRPTSTSIPHRRSREQSPYPRF
jgi:hypothetical protein